MGDTVQTRSEVNPFLRSFTPFRQYPNTSILAFSPTRNLVSSSLELTHPMHMQSNSVGNNNRKSTSDSARQMSLLSGQTDAHSTNNTQQNNTTLLPGSMLRPGSSDTTPNILQSIQTSNSLINSAGNGEGFGNEFRWTL